MFLNKVINLITLLCILFYSCNPVYKKSDTFNTQKFYEDINSYGEDYKIHVILTTNELYLGKNITVNEDSTSWINSETKQRITFKTSTIHRIVIRSKISSGTVGALIGALSATALFYLLGFREYHGQVNPLLIIGIISGAAIGGFFGVFQSNEKVFILNE